MPIGSPIMQLPLAILHRSILQAARGIGSESWGFSAGAIARGRRWRNVDCAGPAVCRLSCSPPPPRNALDHATGDNRQSRSYLKMRNAVQLSKAARDATIKRSFLKRKYPEPRRKGSFGPTCRPRLYKRSDPVRGSAFAFALVALSESMKPASAMRSITQLRRARPSTSLSVKRSGSFARPPI
jgi:hypothetical protein